MDIWIISFVVYLLPFGLHFIGFALLLTKSKNISSSQKILLVNLSISEMFTSSSGAISAMLLQRYGEGNVAYQFSTIVFLTVIIPFYLIMFVLTMDRFAEVYLNIRYPLYWSAKRTRNTVVIAWLITLLHLVFTIIYVLSFDNASKTLFIAYFTYVCPILDVAFVITAAMTYGYIMFAMHKNKQRLTPSGSHEDRTNRATTERKRTFKNSKRPPSIKRLLLPSLLFTTYIVFFFVPDAVYFFSLVGAFTSRNWLLSACHIAYGIGFCSDALIYVLLSTKWKDVLRQCLRIKQVK